MNKFFVIILVLFSISSYSQSKDETEIRNLLNRQNEAWNRGDVETFMIGYWENDSLMFVGKTGVVYGYKNTLERYKKSYPDTASMGKLNFTFIQFKQLSPEYFHVTGKYYLTRSIGDASGHFTLLFRKINGKWVIIEDHSS